MAERDYEVGYGKPPKHSRFKPEQSGNPKGRSRGSLGLRAELKAEMSELVTITENGKSRRLPKRRLMLKALAAKAVKGDVRAADKLLQTIIQAEGFEDPRSERNRLSDADRQILELLLSRVSVHDGHEQATPSGARGDTHGLKPRRNGKKSNGPRC